MIKLTRTNDTPIFINPESIITVTRNESNHSCSYVIAHEGNGLVVKESPEEVVNKMLDYKMAIIRYETAIAEELHRYSDQTSVYNESGYAKYDLQQLAGLEGNK